MPLCGAKPRTQDHPLACHWFEKTSKKFIHSRRAECL